MKQPSTSRRLLAATSVLVTLAATSLLSAAPAAAKTAPTPGPSALSIAVGPTSECDAVVGQLVANCGFEAGDLTNWTPVNTTNYTFADPGDYWAPHSGDYGLVTGEYALASLSQDVATTIGDTYYIRFYVDGGFGAEDDGVSFEATLDKGGGASPLLTLGSVNLGGWTAYSYSFTALAEAATLTFTARNDPAYWYVDDVSIYEQVAPAVTSSPTDQTVTDGVWTTFTAAASGAYTPTVQWQELTDSGGTWADVAGATSDSLSFTASSSMNGYQYRAVYTNDAGTATSDSATLTVTAATAPTVTTQPDDQTVTAGNSATFTAGASGDPAPTVQWQVMTDSGSTWADVEGATSDTLSFTASYAMNGYQYRAVYTNSADTATSNAATLTVNALAPTVTTQPDNQTVTAGNTATFTAGASGDPAPTVQWQVLTDSGSTWADVEGATSDTLSFTASYAMNGYQYRAVYTNTADTATSNAATLTVNAGPATVTGLTAVSSKGSVTVTFSGAGNPVPTLFQCMLPVGKKTPTWTSCASGDTIKSSAKTVSVRASNTNGDSWGTASTANVTK